MRLTEATDIGLIRRSRFRAAAAAILAPQRRSANAVQPQRAAVSSSGSPARRARRPTAVELYAGAGGMSLGFQSAGFRVLAAVESDPINVAVHSANLSDTTCVQANLLRIDARDLRRRCGLRRGEPDVLFGGPPCQGFSEIGPRDERDPRNRHLSRFAYFIVSLKPRYFVVENVPGLLYKWSGRALEQFLRRVRKAGYKVIDPIQILNASSFGVPQRRRRAFLLGYRTGAISPRYPEAISGRPPTVVDAITDLPEVDDIESLLEEDVYVGPLGAPSPYAAALRVPKNGGPEPNVARLTGCKRTNHSEDVRQRFGATEQGRLEPGSRCYRLAPDRVSFTLRAGTGPDAGSFTAARHIHPYRPRYITVRESARLHSFPDWFEFNSRKWHALRQIGNSVPPLLANAVAREILRAWKADQKAKTRTRRRGR